MIASPSRLRLYRPALLWASVVGGVLLLPGSESPPQFTGLAAWLAAWLAAFAAAGGDKLVHGLSFALLGGLLVRAFAADRVKGGPVAAVVLGIGYGAATEWLQNLVPGRAADGLDLLADGLGTLLGAAVARWSTLAVGARVGPGRYC